MENPFEFIPGFADSNEASDTESVTVKNIITAYQLIRIVRSAGDFYYRTILDTILVKGSIEHARDRATVKAQRLGNCIVLELSEKVVATVDKEE